MGASIWPTRLYFRGGFNLRLCAWALKIDSVVPANAQSPNRAGHRPVSGEAFCFSPAQRQSVPTMTLEALTMA